jgi:hypothetical protein
MMMQGTDGATYADQRQVYDDLGQGVLNNAYAGFNSWCTFFSPRPAYALAPHR